MTTRARAIHFAFTIQNKRDLSHLARPLWNKLSKILLASFNWYCSSVLELLCLGFNIWRVHSLLDCHHLDYRLLVFIVVHTSLSKCLISPKVLVQMDIGLNGVGPIDPVVQMGGVWMTQYTKTFLTGILKHHMGWGSYSVDMNLIFIKFTYISSISIRIPSKNNFQQ